MAPDYDSPPPIPFDDDSDATATPSVSKPKSDDFFDVAPSPKPAAPPAPAPTLRVPPAGMVSHDGDDKLHRQTHATGRGATRTRTFHAKLNDGAMAFLDGQINEWLDQHPDHEVKFATTTIGIVEGKRQEPHLIINVWY